MPNFTVKMDHIQVIRLRMGPRPRPRWGAHSAPQTSEGLKERGLGKEENGEGWGQGREWGMEEVG